MAGTSPAMTAESPRRHSPRIAAAAFASASYSLAPLYVLLTSSEASFVTG
jgi:hypothetical protein